MESKPIWHYFQPAEAQPGNGLGPVFSPFHIHHKVQGYW